jgi:hypothetical protein
VNMGKSFFCERKQVLILFFDNHSSWLGATAHCLNRAGFAKVAKRPGAPAEGASGALVDAKIVQGGLAVHSVESPLRIVAPISLNSVI